MVADRTLERQRLAPRVVSVRVVVVESSEAGHALRVISTMKDAEESGESRRQRRELLDHLPAPFLLSPRFSCINSTV